MIRRLFCHDDNDDDDVVVVVVMVEQVRNAKQSTDDKTNVDDNEDRLGHLLQKLLAAPQVTCAFSFLFIAIVTYLWCCIDWTSTV